MCNRNNYQVFHNGTIDDDDGPALLQNGAMLHGPSINTFPYGPNKLIMTSYSWCTFVC